MTPLTTEEMPSEQLDGVADLLHAMSQPITALECGLELSLRKDKTLVELRARLRASLFTARLLHQRLVEFRVLQDAGDPGETSRPVAMQAILRQLREDFLPVSQSAHVKLAVKCELAIVQGDEARLRNGFFHLLEFLMRICPPHGHLRIFAGALTSAFFKVNFSSDSSISTKAKEPSRFMTLIYGSLDAPFRPPAETWCLQESR